MTYVIGLYAFMVLGLTAAEYMRRRGLQIWLKPLAALLFILIAVFGGALYWDYGRIILTGLIACAAGDVLLLSRESPARFQLGMAAFALGHILYLIGFFKITEQAGISPFAILPIIAGALYFYWVRPKLPKDMVIPVAIYSLIIIAMVAKSFGASLIIVPVAAILFAISDMFVAKDRFVDDNPSNALAITPLYFGAQALFALSAAI